jgi:UDP-2,3-diacylglucosamine pyrophosphatase LpxH
VRAIVLSDLHLGAAGGTGTSDAFVSFVEWVAERSREDVSPWRLVVLGDFLDLLHVPADARDPLEALDAVAARQRPVLAAVGAAAAQGLRIDVVPGNHDSELVDPGVQERLRALVADASGTSAVALRQSLCVRPWFLLVPGLLYAEHGSQYHALNAVADPMAPFGRWSGRLPPGAVLDLLLNESERGARVRALPLVLPAALRALARRDGADASTVASLQTCAAASELSAGALDAIGELAEDSRAALLRSAGASALGRRGQVESQQRRAAVEIHRILAGEGRSVPVYVFGHTHRAAHYALDAGDSRLLWFNGGAWTDGSRYAFVEVYPRSGGVVAGLCRWDPVARSAVAVSGPLPAAGWPAPGWAPQDRAPATRPRSVGSGSAAAVARP